MPGLFGGFLLLNIYCSVYCLVTPCLFSVLFSSIVLSPFSIYGVWLCHWYKQTLRLVCIGILHVSCIFELCLFILFIVKLCHDFKHAFYIIWITTWSSLHKTEIEDGHIIQWSKKKKTRYIIEFTWDCSDITVIMYTLVLGSQSHETVQT